LDLLNKLTN